MGRASTAQTKADMRRQAAREAREASRRAEAAEVGVQRRMEKMRQAQLAETLQGEDDDLQCLSVVTSESPRGRSSRDILRSKFSPNGMSIASTLASPSKALRDLKNKPRQCKLSIMEEFRLELEEIEVLKEVLRERFFNECRERLEEGNKAAENIQRHVRGKQARLKVQKLIEENAPPVYGPEHHFAVTKLQAQVRRRAVRPLVEAKRRERDAQRQLRRERSQARRAERKRLEKQRQEEEDQTLEVKRQSRLEFKERQRKDMEADVAWQRKINEEMREEERKRAEEEARTLQGVRKHYAKEMEKEVKAQELLLHEQIARESTQTQLSSTQSTKRNINQVRSPNPVQLSPTPSIDEDILVSPAAMPVEESRIDVTPPPKLNSPVNPADAILKRQNTGVDEAEEVDDSGDFETPSKSDSPTNDASDIESIPEINMSNTTKTKSQEQKSTEATAAASDDSDDDDDGLEGLIQLAKQTQQLASAREKEGKEEKSYLDDDDCDGVVDDDDSSSNDLDQKTYEGKSQDFSHYSGLKRPSYNEFSFEAPRDEDEPSQPTSPEMASAQGKQKSQLLSSPPSSSRPGAVAEYEDDFEDLDEIAL